MQVKCGTDIIEIERVKEAIERLGEPFINRIFTPKEIEYCESKKQMKFQHYAARFAAKEAAFKAMSGISKQKEYMDWKNFEVENDQAGRPVLHMDLQKENAQLSWDISLSHNKEYAQAVVVVMEESEEGK